MKLRTWPVAVAALVAVGAGCGSSSSSAAGSPSSSGHAPAGVTASTVANSEQAAIDAADRAGALLVTYDWHNPRGPGSLEARVAAASTPSFATSYQPIVANITASLAATHETSTGTAINTNVDTFTPGAAEVTVSVSQVVISTSLPTGQSRLVGYALSLVYQGGRWLLAGVRSATPSTPSTTVPGPTLLPSTTSTP